MAKELRSSSSPTCSPRFACSGNASAAAITADQNSEVSSDEDSRATKHSIMVLYLVRV